MHIPSLSLLHVDLINNSGSLQCHTPPGPTANGMACLGQLTRTSQWGGVRVGLGIIQAGGQLKGCRAPSPAPALRPQDNADTFAVTATFAPTTLAHTPLPDP